MTSPHHARHHDEDDEYRTLIDDSNRGGTTDTRAPSASRRRTASEQVSAALLSAAEAVLDRTGAKGVTIRAVAAQAGVAPMGVYNRFESKEGLIGALAMRALDELADAITVPSDIEPVERFRRACDGYRDFALCHPARYALVFASGSPLEDRSSLVAERGRLVFDTLVDLIRAVVADAGGTEPIEAGQAVWNAVHGAVTIEQAGLTQTADAAASYGHLLDVLIAGLLAAPNPA
ncbi:TetR/AcrR family transcriptional regulator [Mycobacterium sp. NPDC003449]